MNSSVFPEILETRSNLIADDTQLEGKITFHQVARIHASIKGEVLGAPGSTLIFGQTAFVEGTIVGEQILIDGFVRGRVRATQKIVLSRTARVFGEIEAPTIEIEFGALFEGRSKSGNAVARDSTARANGDPLPSTLTNV